MAKVGCGWMSTTVHHVHRAKHGPILVWNTHPPGTSGRVPIARPALSKHPAPLILSLGTYIFSEGPPTSTLVLSSGPHHDRQIRRLERVTTSSFTYRFLFLFGLRAFWNSPFLPFIRIADAVPSCTITILSLSARIDPRI